MFQTLLYVVLLIGIPSIFVVNKVISSRRYAKLQKVADSALLVAQDASKVVDNTYAILKQAEDKIVELGVKVFDLENEVEVLMSRITVLEDSPNVDQS